MYLKNISIRNFRRLKDVEIDFDEKETVFVRPNNSGNPPKNIRVLPVLEFNGDVLCEPLDENALDAILGDYTVADSNQADLFSYYAGR